MHPRQPPTSPVTGGSERDTRDPQQRPSLPPPSSLIRGSAAYVEQQQRIHEEHQQQQQQRASISHYAAEHQPARDDAHRPQQPYLYDHPPPPAPPRQHHHEQAHSYGQSHQPHTAGWSSAAPSRDREQTSPPPQPPSPVASSSRLTLPPPPPQRQTQERPEHTAGQLPPSTAPSRPPLPRRSPPPRRQKLSSIPAAERAEMWYDPDSADCIIIVPVPTRENQIPDVSLPRPSSEKLRAARAALAKANEAERDGSSSAALSAASGADAGPSVSIEEYPVAGPSSLAARGEAGAALPPLPRRDPQNFIQPSNPDASVSRPESESAPASDDAESSSNDPHERRVVHREVMSPKSGREFGQKLRQQLELFGIGAGKGPRWLQDEDGNRYAPEGWRKTLRGKHGFDSSIHSTVGHFKEDVRDGSFKRHIFRAHVRVLATQCGLVEDLLTRQIIKEPEYKQGGSATCLEAGGDRSTSSFSKKSIAHKPRYAMHFTRPPGEQTNENAEVERILFLPVPDPISFPLLLHYLYFGQTDVFAAALERDNAVEIARSKADGLTDQASEGDDTDDIDPDAELAKPPTNLRSLPAAHASTSEKKSTPSSPSSSRPPATGLTSEAPSASAPPASDPPEPSSSTSATRSEDNPTATSSTTETTRKKGKKRKSLHVPPTPQAVLDRIPAELFSIQAPWRGVIWNAEHLALGKPLEKYLGSWYKHKIRYIPNIKEVMAGQAAAEARGQKQKFREEFEREHRRQSRARKKERERAAAQAAAGALAEGAGSAGAATAAGDAPATGEPKSAAADEAAGTAVASVEAPEAEAGGVSTSSSSSAVGVARDVGPGGAGPSSRRPSAVPTPAAAMLPPDLSSRRESLVAAATIPREPLALGGGQHAGEPASGPNAGRMMASRMLPVPAASSGGGSGLAGAGTPALGSPWDYEHERGERELVRERERDWGWDRNREQNLYRPSGLRPSLPPPPPSHHQHPAQHRHQQPVQRASIAPIIRPDDLEEDVGRWADSRAEWDAQRPPPHPHQIARQRRGPSPSHPAQRRHSEWAWPRDPDREREQGWLDAREYERERERDWHRDRERDFERHRLEREREREMDTLDREWQRDHNRDPYARHGPPPPPLPPGPGPGPGSLALASVRHASMSAASGPPGDEGFQALPGPAGPGSSLGARGSVSGTRRSPLWSHRGGGSPPPPPPPPPRGRGITHGYPPPGRNVPSYGAPSHQHGYAHPESEGGPPVEYYARSGLHHEENSPQLPGPYGPPPPGESHRGSLSYAASPRQHPDAYEVMHPAFHPHHHAPPPGVLGPTVSHGYPHPGAGSGPGSISGRGTVDPFIHSRRNSQSPFYFAPPPQQPQGSLPPPPAAHPFSSYHYHHAPPLPPPPPHQQRGHPPSPPPQHRGPGGSPTPPPGFRLGPPDPNEAFYPGPSPRAPMYGEYPARGPPLDADYPYHLPPRHQHHGPPPPPGAPPYPAPPAPPPPPPLQRQRQRHSVQFEAASLYSSSAELSRLAGASGSGPGAGPEGRHAVAAAPSHRGRLSVGEGERRSASPSALEVPVPVVAAPAPAAPSRARGSVSGASSSARKAKRGSKSGPSSTADANASAPSTSTPAAVSRPSIRPELMKTKPNPYLPKDVKTHRHLPNYQPPPPPRHPRVPVELQEREGGGGGAGPDGPSTTAAAGTGSGGAGGAGPGARAGRGSTSGPSGGAGRASGNA